MPISGVKLTDNREKREPTAPPDAAIFTIKENGLQTGKGRTNMGRRKLEPKLEEVIIGRAVGDFMSSEPDKEPKKAQNQQM